MTERSLLADAAVAASAHGHGVTAPGSDIPPPPPPELPPEAQLPPPPPPANGLVPPVTSQAVAPRALDGPLRDDEDSDEEGTTTSEWWLQAPSWLTSTVLHLTLVLVLALLATSRVLPHAGSSALVSAEQGDGAGDEGLSSDLAPFAVDDGPPEATSPGELSELPAAAALGDSIGPISAMLGNGTIDPKLAGGGTSIEDAIGIGSGGGTGNGLELRLSGASRADMVRRGGGTAESEHAVTLALQWLAEHQNYDGSWSFQHHNSPKCHGKCANPGYSGSKTAATAMALLPFLGTGQTHHEGQYKRNIDLGLKYLIRSMQSQGDVGSLWEPNGMMYAHGLASIALCEAYGMTHDQALQVPAQSAVNFIVYAQDPNGGGWRYQVQTPGDTSVVGWQMMALKSAQMAYLRVPPLTMRKAGYFLDSVQGERGAVYGYTGPDGRRPATTAIGLLCRMYLGWKHETEPLQHGVQILSQLGPSTDKTGMINNMYYNYYATQVMHHYGGYPWQRWNAVMREYLIHTQDHRGHEAGSWFLEGSDHGAGAGGRLYCTALAAMTLEVYYRYMPLYRPQSTISE